MLCSSNRLPPEERREARKSLEPESRGGAFKEFLIAAPVIGAIALLIFWLPGRYGKWFGLERAHFWMALAFGVAGGLYFAVGRTREQR